MTRDPFGDVKDGLGGGPDTSRRLRQRARALNGAGLRRHPLALGLAAATTGALLAAGTLGIVLWRPAETVTENGAEVALGAELVAAEPRTLTFAEGSAVSLAGGSTARLVAADSSHVDVLLERGQLAANVKKGTGRTWRYFAGAWTVRVVGTQLSIAWEPATRALEVRVTEGAVEVSGPGVEQRRVGAGESFARRLDPSPVVGAPGAGASAEADLAADAGMTGGRGSVAAAGAVVGPHTAGEPEAPRSWRALQRSAPPLEPDAGPPAAPTPDWRALLAAGKRAQALASADESGALSRLDTLDDEDALALADAARLERRPELTRRLLTQVLAGDGSEAAEAAFLLGRLEADEHRPDAAAVFFRRAARLAPDGPFAEQSQGRLMEALLELGDGGAARATAADYLRDHPAGAWTGLAKRLVTGDGGW